MRAYMLSQANLPASKENFREVGLHMEPFNIVLCTLIDFICFIKTLQHSHRFRAGLPAKCVSFEKTAFFLTETPRE